MIAWTTLPFHYPRRTPWWKRPFDERCVHGLDIFLVNGTHVRNAFDSDFDQGGNGYAYAWIPKSEIWIAEEVPKVELPYVAFHECTEVELMRHGLDYDHAHDIAKMEEDRLRRELLHI